MAKQQQTDSPKPDSALETTLKRFKNSQKYAKDNWYARWERDYDLYNNKRHNRGYEGITDTFVPMAFSTVETMVAALGNGRPRFDYEPADPTQKAETKSLNSLIADYWECDRWDVKVVEAIREMLKVGTSCLFLYWDIDKPRMLHQAIKDTIVDPTATSPENLEHAGRRYLTTMDELKEFEVVDIDPASKTYGQLIPRYKNLDAVEASRPNTEDMDREYKDMFDGSTLPTALEDQIEVIEIWDEDRVISVANRKFVIEDIENPYKTQDRQNNPNNPHGLIPFIFFRNYTDVSQFYAKSEIEPIAPLQENLNDMTNMEADAIIKQLAQQRELDPAYQDFIDLINNDPDTVYPFKPGSLKAIETPIIPANSFNNRMNIKNEIRETTAIDQVAKGVTAESAQTATEIKAQLGQAGQRIEIKARLLEKDGFYWMGKLLFRMIQLYVKEPMAVSMPQTPGQQPVQLGNIQLPKGTGVFDPAQYKGEWEPHVSLEVNTKNKQSDEQHAAQQAFQIVIQDPTNNLEEAKRIFYPKMFPDLQPDELEKLLTPPAQPAMALGMAPVGGPGMPAGPVAPVAPPAAPAPAPEVPSAA